MVELRMRDGRRAPVPEVSGSTRTVFKSIEAWACARPPEPAIDEVEARAARSSAKSDGSSAARQAPHRRETARGVAQRMAPSWFGVPLSGQPRLAVCASFRWHLATLPAAGPRWWARVASSKFRSLSALAGVQWHDRNCVNGTAQLVLRGL